MEKTAVLVVCGALGCTSANLLVRNGIKYLKIIDRDYIEESNLQRQSLFDEEDIKKNLPKVVKVFTVLHPEIPVGVYIPPGVKGITYPGQEVIESHLAYGCRVFLITEVRGLKEHRIGEGCPTHGTWRGRKEKTGEIQPTVFSEIPEDVCEF